MNLVFSVFEVLQVFNDRNKNHLQDGLMEFQLN